MNRPDPDHLREWRHAYNATIDGYMRRQISRLELGSALQDLGYRSDALRCEIRDVEIKRNKAAMERNL